MERRGGESSFQGLDFPEGLDVFLWRPVLAGMWKQSELGTYDFNDLCEMNSVLEWKEANIRLLRERQENS